MTWLIISNIEFTWRFSVVAHLAFIPYSFFIRSFLNAQMRNLFPWLYLMALGV